MPPLIVRLSVFVLVVVTTVCAIRVFGYYNGLNALLPLSAILLSAGVAYRGWFLVGTGVLGLVCYVLFSAITIDPGS